MILYETKYLTLKSAKREGLEDWVYAIRPNAKNIVGIVPVIKTHDGDEILFLITKRPPLYEEKTAEYCIETPAGLVGDENKDETIIEACKKELLEEVGMVADKIKCCASKVSTSGGLTNECCTIMLAEIIDDTIVKEPVNDGGVIIDRIRVKKQDIKAFLRQKEEEGYAISALALAGLYYL